MSYVPKSLNAEQQKYVLGLVNADYEAKKASATLAEITSIVNIVTILNEPPSERAPKAKAGNAGAKPKPATAAKPSA